MASLKPNEMQRSLLHDVRSLQTKARSSEQAFAKTGLAVIRPAAFDGGQKEFLTALRAPLILRQEPSRDQAPQAKAFGRVPENCPLDGFLNEIPPHRFESLLKRMGRALIDIGQARGSERCPGECSSP